MIETTIKWHKTSEELPQKTGWVWLFLNNMTMTGGYYVHERKLFVRSTTSRKIEKNLITYWAYEDEIVNQLKEKTADYSE